MLLFKLGQTSISITWYSPEKEPCLIYTVTYLPINLFIIYFYLVQRVIVYYYPYLFWYSIIRLVSRSFLKTNTSLLCLFDMIKSLKQNFKKKISSLLFSARRYSKFIVFLPPLNPGVCFLHCFQKSHFSLVGNAIQKQELRGRWVLCTLYRILSNKHSIFPLKLNL